MPLLSSQCLNHHPCTMQRTVSSYKNHFLLLFIYPSYIRHRRLVEQNSFHKFQMYGKYHNWRSLFLRYHLVLCRRQLSMSSFHFHASAWNPDRVDGFDFHFGLIPTGIQISSHPTPLNLTFFFSQKVLHLRRSTKCYRTYFNDFWRLDVPTDIYWCIHLG